MAFNRNFITAQSSSLTHIDVPAMWVYDGSGGIVNDTVATIKASAYFNNMEPAFTVGAFLYILGTDGGDLVRVTAITPNVTVTSIIGALPPGSVEKVDLAEAIVYDFRIRHALEDFNTTGGSAQEAFTVTGTQAGDIAFVQVTGPDGSAIFVHGATTSLNSVNITFSADPGVSTVISIMVLRPAL